MALMFALRVLVSLLLGALGVVLLTAGHVVIGGLLLALAVVRLVMTAVMWVRRRERQAKVTAWRAGRGLPGPVA